MQVYNNTIHSSTGLTPHFVVFGRHARLPVDLCVEAQPPQERATLDGWVSYHQQALTTAYQQVQARTKQRQAWDQTRYNKRAQAAPLLPGERVLIRNFRRRARGKLEPRWVPSPFVILSQV